MADETNAYVGYRSAGRRKPQHNDRRASADAPLAALRGLVSGVAGAPGDIESLVRMLPGLSEQTVLPTSEDVERRLPLRSVSETPLGRAVTGASQIGGGFYTGPGSPLRALAAVPGALRHGAGEFVRAAGQPAVQVIKPKGGNWLAGSAEKAVEPLRVRERTPGVNQHTEEMAASDSAFNRWLETKLARYIRNEMGTPEDPVRALAERGVTHAEMPPLATFDEGLIGKRRTAAGFPAEGMAQSELARRYEAAADVAIHNLPASARTDREALGGVAYQRAIERDPWLLKVPPETMTYGAYPMEVAHEMNFSHLADELRNAINPESGLPVHLLWKYGDLDKVTVPQAVQRVHDINEWRAAQKAEADLMRAQNAATFTHKEYPEAGFRWVELKAGDLPEGWSKNSYGQYEIAPGFEHTASADGLPPTYKALEDALKYEGETMGHCVGGYCPDVLEGRSRIYSLRDKKGQPHVTIEVQPADQFASRDRLFDLKPEEYRAVGKRAEEMVDAGRFNNMNDAMTAAANEVLGEPPPQIVQIKGKANRAPNAEYLPYVQDFVRSGRWGSVGDIKNAGLVDIGDEAARLYGVDRFMTGEDWLKHDKKIRSGETGLTPGARGEGFATGGLVTGMTENVDPFRTDAAANPVNAHYFADGGQAGDAPAYAAGGAVEAAGSDPIPYDAAKIQGLVDSLREEMNG